MTENRPFCLNGIELRSLLARHAISVRYEAADFTSNKAPPAYSMGETNGVAHS